MYFNAGTSLTVHVPILGKVQSPKLVFFKFHTSHNLEKKKMFNFKFMSQLKVGLCRSQNTNKMYMYGVYAKLEIEKKKFRY